MTTAHVAPAILVTTAAESAAADATTIAAGVPSRGLMQRAGAAAAGEIVRRFGDRLGAGVAIHAGPGNNGGDAWVVARALQRAGIRVGVTQWGSDAPTTPDARFEFDRAHDGGPLPAPSGAEQVIVDGVLGTGARAPARAFVERYVAQITAQRAGVSGAGAPVVVALDVPTGLDATTGASTGAMLRADLTLVFGTLKRGLLVDRDAAGSIALLDIGLVEAALASGDSTHPLPQLVTASVMRDGVPAIGASAHKGIRGKVAIIGGAPGMAGATVLASDAALRSGAGMVRAIVAPESVPVLQNGLHAAMATPWPAADDDDALQRAVIDWADVLLVGPGLGRSDAAAALLERVLAAWRGPIVVDADALNHFAGRLEALGAHLDGRPALLTPHPLELARLLGTTADDVLAHRFEIAGEAARTARAAVLLKGVPTVVSDGAETYVSATGTPALGTAGSGDVLGGIAAALLAHATEPARAVRVGAAAAWVHGHAGELATARRGGVRGTTLPDVLDALRDAWPRPERRDGVAPYPVLAELPRVPG